MRKLIALLSIAAAATALAGCGGGDEDESTAATSSGVPFDRAFIDAMVPHHRAAITMAKEAQEGGLMNEELSEVAADIIEAQEREIDQMLDWREEWFGSREIAEGGASALGLSEEEAGMKMHESGSIATAGDVDQAFAQAMIPHHDGAIEMAKLAREKGDHDEIRELADEIIEAQEREIEILRPHTGGMNHG
ncbi:MAG: DUF305 domain-containing protein [Actinobacteria bacterium]|nr:DUF305 domain-containing protein [Actinomycetota bacterium]